MLGLAALLLAATSPGAAAKPAEPPRLSLFADRFYRGAAQTFTADTVRLPEPIEPQSLSMAGRWEVCSDADFRGRCFEVDRDYPVAAALGDDFTVRSLRQLAPGTGVSKPDGGVGPGGISITGVASRYWPAPTYGAERVLACAAGKPGVNCAHDTAEDLCRRAGYRAARYWQLQTVTDRVYLADVLCTRNDDK